MRKSWRRTPIAIVFLCVDLTCISAQVATDPSQKAQGDGDVLVTLSQATIDAGQQLKIQVGIKEPLACPTQIFVRFINSDRIEFDAGAVVKGDETTFTLTGKLPVDLPSGDYVASTGMTNACPNHRKGSEFTFPPVTVSVRAIPDTVPHPTTADVTLSVNQKQFLDTKATELGDINSQLNARLHKDSADLPALRVFLIQIVRRAEDALNVTEDQYRKKIIKSGGKEPALFADFHAQYHALLVRLNKPSSPTNSLTRGIEPGNPQFVRVQLSDTKEQLGNTWPPIAQSTENLIKDNISAYEHIRDTGRDTFKAKLISTPAGARVSYKGQIDTEYQVYPTLTDAQDVSFELATWYFIFHLEGCDDEFNRVDPYQGTEPILINVRFTHCRRR